MGEGAALSVEQERLLNAILDHRIATFRWPTLKQVAPELRREMNVEKVSASLRGRFGHAFGSFGNDSEIMLPVTAIARCSNMPHYYRLMPRLVEVLREIYLGPAREPRITSDDLVKRGWSQQEVKEAGVLLRNETLFSGGGAGWSESGDWHMDIGAEIREFPKSTTPEEYLRYRLEDIARHERENAESANRFPFRSEFVLGVEPAGHREDAVLARIERERSEQRDLRRTLLGAAWVGLGLIGGVLLLFLAEIETFLFSEGHRASLIPIGVAGLVVGKALTRVVVAIILRSLYSEMGTARPALRQAFLVASTRQVGVRLRVMADDLALDVVLAAYFAWRVNASAGIPAIAAAVCAFGFAYNALAAFVQSTQAPHAQATILEMATSRTTPPGLAITKTVAIVTFSISLLAYPLALWLVGRQAATMGSIDGVTGAYIRGVLAFGFAFAVIPTVSTLLLRRAADRSLDIVNELEERIEGGSIEPDEAVRVLRALKLSRGQLLVPTDVENLLRAHDQISKKV